MKIGNEHVYLEFSKCNDETEEIEDQELEGHDNPDDKDTLFDVSMSLSLEKKK